MSTPTISEPRASARAVQRTSGNRAPLRTVSRIKLGVRPRSTLPTDCIRTFTEFGVGLRTLTIFWDHDQPGWQIVTCEVQSCPQPIARQIADRIARGSESPAGHFQAEYGETLTRGAGSSTLRA